MGDHDSLSSRTNGSDSSIIRRRCELSSKIIVDLEKDLDFRVFIMEDLPDTVNNDCYCGLWYPRECFWQYAFDAVEIKAPVAKPIPNLVALFKIFLNSLMPSGDTRVRRKPSSAH